MDLNLAPQRLLHLWCFNHSLVKFFNGHFNATRLVQSQLDLSVGAFAQTDTFELQFFKLHTGQHLFVLVSLACDAQLARLDERGRLFDALDLSRVQSGHDAPSTGVCPARAFILMSHLPVLVEAVVRAVDQRSDFLLRCSLCFSIDNVSDVS